jgi:hypothetical protein
MKLKKQEDRTLGLSHVICSYIRMYINEVAGSVMEYFKHDFYNIIFKIKHKFYITSLCQPPRPHPSKKKFWVRTLNLWTLNGNVPVLPFACKRVKR